MKYLSFALSDYGKVLATRAEGLRAASDLRRLATEPRDVVVDFAHVEAVTPPFIDELLRGVEALLERHGSSVLVATNLNEDVRETLEMVLERRNHALAHFHEDELGLLGGAPHLAETLREARRLGEFTASQLAERLALKLPNANQRLVALHQAGAVGRERDLQAERGIRFRYWTADPTIKGRAGS